MGSFFSCCCGPRSRQEEREPLLPQHNERRERDEHIIPPQETFNKLADVVAALASGKLPSQDQLNHFIQRVLTSGNLERSNEQNRGILSQRGSQILDDVVQVLQALLEMGTEKNTDDRVQDIIYQLLNVRSNPISVNPQLKGEVSYGVEAGASKVYSGIEVNEREVTADMQEAMSSVMALASLLFTSSTFRILLSDIILTSREILADVASDVGAVAETVAGGAGVVEDIVRPSEAEKAEVPSNQEGLVSEPPNREQEDKHGMERDLKWSAEVRSETEQKIEETIQASKERSGKAWQRVSSSESTDRVKDQIIWRVKAIIQQVQANPAYRDALSTLITLLQKYTEKMVQTASMVTSAVEAGVSSAVNETNLTAEVDLNIDPHLNRAMDDLKIMIERFAGGKSVDTFLLRFGDAVHDMRENVQDEQETDIQAILRQTREFLDRALENPQWISSIEADSQARSIYDEVKTFIHGNSEEGKKFGAYLRDALSELQNFTARLQNDRATQHLLAALSSLSFDAAYLTAISKPDVANLLQQETRRAAVQVKRELRNDLLGFALPRLLRAVQVVPLPRVEFKSPSLDATIDNINLQSLSFVPDRIYIANWNSVEFVGSDGARERGSQTAIHAGIPTVTVSEALSRTRIQIEGLRISAKEIAYWVDAKGPAWLGWNDYGLLSIDVGGRGESGEGMKVTIDVEMVGENLDDPNPMAVEDAVHSQFKVLDVKVDIPGLKFTITKSRHWIFNSVLLQPLLGPSVRQLVSTILQNQIRSALEKVDEKFGEAKKVAGQRGASSAAVWDWWNVLIRTPEEEDEASDSDSDREPHTPPAAQTSTSVTFKGVVKRTHTPATKPDQDTVLAIGIGEQILPNVPLPQPGIEQGGHASKVEDVRPILAQQGREALDDLQTSADQVTDTVADVIHTADDARNRVREELSVATERLERRKRVERNRSGWRSAAFNID